jgi:beta-lactamase regulating signal transducer with metallopeptidase domain
MLDALNVSAPTSTPTSTPTPTKPPTNSGLGLTYIAIIAVIGAIAFVVAQRILFLRRKSKLDLARNENKLHISLVKEP